MVAKILLKLSLWMPEVKNVFNMSFYMGKKTQFRVSITRARGCTEMKAS